jgi:phosphohistidine phosphatase
MKNLYIVRHAKSSWDYPELSDIDRPLNKRGKKNAPEMGQRLAAKNISPELLISSPAKRAHTTARRIAKEIGYEKSKIIVHSKLYHGGLGEMIELIQSTDKSINSLMIFGHNPGFTELANYLTGSNIYNIPTCGIVSIEFDTDDWAIIGQNEGKMLFFDYPKKVHQ